MSDPQAEHKNFFCSLCKGPRFASRPAARDHIYAYHPGKKVFILKYVETLVVDDVETINPDAILSVMSDAVENTKARHPNCRGPFKIKFPEDEDLDEWVR